MNELGNSPADKNYKPSGISRAEEAALKAYPHLEQATFDEMYPRLLFTRNTERSAFVQGYEQAEKDLGWHSVDESLPPVDEEVIVLTDVVNSNYPENKIDGADFMCFGHIVDPDAVVDVYGNPYKVVYYNGWNIPGVKYWMPFPKLPEK